MLGLRKITIANVAIVVVALWLSGCGGGRQALKVEPIPLSADPAKEVNGLEKEIGNARLSQLNVLTPTSFKKAEGYYRESRTMLEKGDGISQILNRVALARAELKRGSEQALIVRSALGEAIEARDSALEAGAAKLGSDYDEVERQFLELTSDVENNNMKRAERNKGKVAEEFRQLEVRAIKVQLLGETRKLIEQAKRDGAERFAPNSLRQAEEKLNAADNFISENPYVKEKRNELAAEALFQAQRTIQITEQSKKVKEMKPEEITLLMEGLLQKATNQLGSPDMRNQNFDTQEKNILESINALQDDHDFLAETVKTQQSLIEDMRTEYAGEMDATKTKYQSEISAMQEEHLAETEVLEKRIASLEGKTREEQLEKQRLAAERRETEARLLEEKRAEEEKLEAEKLALEAKLASERQFNQKFTEVQRFFDPDEAEVYKQGNRLIIRLKGIQFPVGKAVIMPDNYALLSKVQKSVRIFGEPDVLIEGHTDSTGSALVNERLSKQRAEAVSEYLLANDVVPEDNITALGYGSERPIASNATSGGRAKNRRIDVIITPVATS